MGKATEIGILSRWPTAVRIIVRMEVILKFHDSTKPAVIAWWKSLGTSRQQRDDLFHIHLDVIRERLSEFRGFPPEVTPVGECQIWEVSRNVWIRYSVRELPPKPRGFWDLGRWCKRFFLSPKLKVVILGIDLG